MDQSRLAREGSYPRRGRRSCGLAAALAAEIGLAALLGARSARAAFAGPGDDRNPSWAPLADFAPPQ
jgi:hypothetical protein